MTFRPWIRRAAAATLTALAAAAAQAAGTVGSSFPADFPVIEDATLQKPVIGFGAAGAVSRTPVIFLHGNNDVPYATPCSPTNGKVQALAQHLADNGWSPSELWGLGYQGDQCDLVASLGGDNTKRARIGHTHQANVPDLRRFVAAVRAYTGAKQVDIVAHSMGATLAREWMRQDDAHRQVRRLVSIDGPHHGIINCSPSPQNYYQLPAFGGFTPSSELCQEVGSPNTPFLKRLNGQGQGQGHGHGHGHGHESGRHSEVDGPTKVLAIRNADTSFVYFAAQDGFFTPVPAMDVYGQAVDFSRSAALKGAKPLDLTGQGIYDAVLGTTHLGILQSPQTQAAVLEFLSASH
jgi:pimeloyl-ACP methyl ester carboxylesterase